MLLLLLTCTMASVLASSAVKDTKDITIDSGIIRGVKETLTTGQVVHKYLGVPYAQAERFEKPVNVPSWEDVRNCTSFGKVCWQISEYPDMPFDAKLEDMSEDCLNLNVYVPSDENESGRLKPVMFWIHGGSYIAGSNRNSNLEGSYLAGLGKVIVVVINYRLLAFGFLHDRPSGFTGNYGLYDQLAALKWVQRNIAAFRGDPNRVTIFGNSAGGMAVSLLCLSPLAKGLFKYAIIQSGSGLSQVASSDYYPNGTMERGLNSSKINCTGYNSTKICLKSIDAGRLQNFNLPVVFAFRPVVDGKMITDDPWKLLQSGNFSQESTLMGVSMNDGSCFTNAIPELSPGATNLTGNLAWNDFKQSLHMAFYLSPKYSLRFPEFRNSFVSVICEKYKNASMNISSPAIRQGRIRRKILDVLTDGFFDAPAIAEANYYANKSAKIFFYRTQYGVRIPKYFKRPSFLNNGYHETTKFMAFGFPLKDNSSYLQKDRDVSKIVIKMWSNFAKTGNPNTPEALGVEWPEYNLDTQQYMAIRPIRFNVNNHLRSSQMAFWKQIIDPSLFQKMYQNKTTRVSDFKKAYFFSRMRNAGIARL